MSQRIFAIVGAKGGVGATTIALELAKHAGARTQCVVVDGDLTGRRAHAVFLDAAAALDAARVPGAPATANARGCTVVELTRSYEDGFALEASAVEAERARLDSDATIFVDAPQPFAAALRPFIARVQRFVLVTEPTLLGAAAARAMLLAMQRAGFPADRIDLVLNLTRGTLDVPRLDIEQALRLRVLFELPSQRDRGWGRALEQLGRHLAASSERRPDLLLQPAVSNPVGDRRDRPRTGAHPNGHLALAPNLQRERVKAELHAAIMSRVDFQAAARAHSDAQKLAELRTQVDEIVASLLSERTDVESGDEVLRIRREIVEEAVGFGPIEGLLHDPEITEIMVNGPTNVYVERHGLLERTEKRFVDERQVRLVIERIIAPLGRRIDEASPMVDARLPDGSRVNAIIEPLSIDGATLTIRRFGSRRMTADDMIGFGSLTRPVVDFLRAAVEARLNIVVSGGTGSGKTTLLNVVSSFIPRSERIVTIEDAAELSLDQPHVVRLESRPPNLEGNGAVPIRELVRNALRMRPDRIIIGEARSGEALDMLQAMNTGHDGSLTTVHANAPRDAIARIETMVLMAGYDIPVRAIREQISSAINLVIQLSRLRDGSRRLVSVSEVIGMEGDVVTMQEIVRFRRQGTDTDGRSLGELEPTGVQPFCLHRFAEMGIDFDITSLGKPAEDMVWAIR